MERMAAGKDRQILKPMTHYEKSAIIGYWRNGMTVEQIRLLTGFFYSEIKEVIEEYKKKISSEK